MPEDQMELWCPTYNQCSPTSRYPALQAGACPNCPLGVVTVDTHVRIVYIKALTIVQNRGKLAKRLLGHQEPEVAIRGHPDTPTIQL